MTYIPPSASCNVCKTAKQETNHWYMVEFRNTEVAIYQFDLHDVELGVPCVCGESCLQKYVSKHLSSIVYPPMEELEYVTLQDGEPEISN